MVVNLSRKQIALLLCGAVAALVLLIALAVLSRANSSSAKASVNSDWRGMHAAPFIHSTPITDDTDRFTGVRSINLHDMKIIPSEPSEEPLQLRAFFIKPSREGEPPSRVVLTFSCSSKEWRYLNYHPLSVLVDGVPLSVPPTDRSSKVVGGSAMEWVSVDLPISTFIKIANAEVVEMRLGITELQLTSDHLEALRDLLSRAIGGYGVKKKSGTHELFFCARFD